jgi:hypothetical protein
MNLVMLAQDFPPTTGGIQTYAHELALGFARRTDRFVVVAPESLGSCDFTRAFSNKLRIAASSSPIVRGDDVPAPPGAGSKSVDLQHRKAGTMNRTTTLRLVRTPKPQRWINAALLGWCLLLAALVAVAALDIQGESASGGEESRSWQSVPRTVDTLCVGGDLEVRMCKVARDGFTVALDY